MYKNIARVIKKKSTGYLKISVTLFLVALLFIGIFTEFCVNQYFQFRKDFIDNNNTHIVEVSLNESRDDLQPLTFADLSDIKKLVKESEGEDADVYAELALSFGIESKKVDDVILIYSLSDEKYLLESGNVSDDTLYGLDTDLTETVLRIPVVEIEDGGVSSSKRVDMPVKIDKNSKLSKTLNLNETVIGKTFVSYDTYKRIIEKCYGMNWENFQRKLDSGEDIGDNIVSRIFVYSDKINRTDDIARLLNDSGYATNYTFKAFDNIDESIKTTLGIVFALLLMILIITGVNSFLSFKSYLKMQKKDMGILKHYGYTAKQINRIYSQIVNDIFFKVTLIAGDITVIAAIIILNGKSIIFGVAAGVLVIAIPSIILNVIVRIALIKKYANEDVLELIKRSKEVE